MKRIFTTLFTTLLLTGWVFAADSFPGHCLEFGNSYAEVGTGGILGDTGEMTVEAWVRVAADFPDGPRVGVVIGNYNLPQNFNLEVYALGQIRFFWNYGEVNLILNNTDLRDDTWHHVAVTRDPSVIRVWLDGLEVGGSAPGSHLYVQWPLRIGSDFRNGSNPGIPFQGDIEEVRLWDYALSEQELRENMHLTLTGTEPGLLGYWQFNEGSGTTVMDSGPDGQHGFTYNNPLWIASDAPLGGGVSQTAIVTAPGVQDFSTAGVEMDFTSFTGSDMVVVSRLDLAPNLLPGHYLDFDSQYWIVNRYGNGIFTVDVTFDPVEDITSGDELYPEQLLLSSRSSNSTGPWESDLAASGAEADANRVTFLDLNAFSQLLISRSYDVVLVSLDPADDEVEVDPGTSLRMIFNVPVYPGDGEIAIVTVEGDELFVEIPASELTFNDSLVIIDPATDFEQGTAYYVEVGGDALHDGSGTYFNGFYGSDVWNFTTQLPFTEIDAGLEGVYSSSCQWGDYDNDGDLDILVAGDDSDLNASTCIYRNDNGSFVEVYSGLTTGHQFGSVQWGDYDNDGDLDILATGNRTYPGNPVPDTRIYRNNGGSFSTAITYPLTDANFSSAQWGDYDNDGDLDVLLMGENNYDENFTHIYRNDDGSFVEIGAGLTGVYYGSCQWGDYDNDGDLDILLSGRNNSSQDITRIYNNEYGSFVEIDPGLTNVFSSSCQWGDYDNDGDLDILLTGVNYSGYYSEVYRNDNGSFVEIGAGLTGVSMSSVQWGDYDNDGDLDILLTGSNSSNNPLTRIYRNVAGSFVEIDAGLIDVYWGSVQWGDYDNDGDLDILLTGRDAGDNSLTRIYRNNCATPNTPPTAPPILNIHNSLTFFWDPAGDAETPAAGLSYNLLIGTPDSPFLFKPGMVDSDNGYRLLPALGNINQSLGWPLEAPYLISEPCYTQESRTIVAAVQAVDHTWAGSPLVMNSYVHNPNPDYLPLENEPVMQPADELSWEIQHWASLAGFQVQIAAQMDFELALIDQLLPIDNRYSEREFMTGIPLNELAGFELLEHDSTYYWRMRPIYTDVWRYTVYSETPGSFVLNSLNSPPLAPLSGFNPTGDAVVSSLTPRLSWGNGSDPDPDDHPGTLHYVIEVDTSDTFTSVEFAGATADGVTHLDVTPALSAGYRYYYHVKTVDDEAAESGWSATQSFLTIMPPQNVTVMIDGGMVTLTWESQPLNSREPLVYTVYSSVDPYAAFPAEWQVVAVQLTEPTWSEPLTDEVKFYRVTVGSISRGEISTPAEMGDGG